ncbi:MAG TPA: sugar transferase [Pirellulaceae bacterium]|nr:sugar transferase [Pirellulaceae bacterium]HMO93430.1 sugar transferase [Pirellulaceae bacterium]HMP68462.1 sugar transferase [Pirellulaceae bacterium]
MFKRGLDLIVSFFLLLALSPLLIALGILIRWRLGSPVLFSQLRPGKRGVLFRMYKFRTMTDACDTAGELLPDHARMTRLGNFLRSMSLDELPELWNVLRGDMSLVGPRPLLMEYLPLYNERQARRHEVRPGITGWAQINGRNAISWEEKFELDVWYVENHSLWLDFRILAATVWKVLSRSGINQTGQATAEKFQGTRP